MMPIQSIMSLGACECNLGDRGLGWVAPPIPNSKPLVSSQRVDGFLDRPSTCPNRWQLLRHGLLSHNRERASGHRPDPQPRPIDLHRAGHPALSRPVAVPSPSRRQLLLEDRGLRFQVGRPNLQAPVDYRGVAQFRAGCHVSAASNPRDATRSGPSEKRLSASVPRRQSGRWRPE